MKGRLWFAIAFTAAALCPVGPAAAGSVDHTPWDALLKQYVDGRGKVAYRRLKENRGEQLQQYLSTLAAAHIDDLPQNDQLAFWINAYNATIVAGMLDGYSAESTFGRYRFFKSYRREIAGEKRTPDDMEHKIIRSRFHDYRTHFAVVCGSTSCPTLRNEAYVGARLDEQLNDQGRRFLNDPLRNRIDAAKGTAEISQIFNWFKEDFSRDGKSFADLLAPYITAERVQVLREKTPRYLDYDWTMNAQEGQRP